MRNRRVHSVRYVEVGARYPIRRGAIGQVPPSISSYRPTHGQPLLRSITLSIYAKLFYSLQFFQKPWAVSGSIRTARTKLFVAFARSGFDFAGVQYQCWICRPADY